MDRIAFIFGETFIYWSSIVLTLAAVLAGFLFLAFYLYKEQNVLAAAVVIPVSVFFSLVIARFVHWYCRSDSYAGFLSAMTDYSCGGYALLGVFAGCALAAVIVRVAGMTDNLPCLLDCMSLAGCAGIAVGRLNGFFNAQDRGQIISSVQSLPWVYPVTNTVSGALEYRLATFVIQAMVTAVIFGALVAFAFATDKKRRDGDLTLFFLLLYGASQVVLDSTRYDSLFFRSNGFISIVQVVSALATGLACAVFSVRLVRTHGMDRRYIALWAIFAAFVGLGGYMEYHVQRHGDQAVFAYSLMSMALLGMVFVVTVIWVLAQKEPEEKPVPENTQTEAVPAQKQERKPKAKFAQPKQTHWEEEEDLYIPLEELGLPEDFFFEDE